MVLAEDGEDDGYECGIAWEADEGRVISGVVGEGEGVVIEPVLGDVGVDEGIALKDGNAVNEKQAQGERGDGRD